METCFDTQALFECVIERARKAVYVTPLQYFPASVTPPGRYTASQYAECQSLLLPQSGPYLEYIVVMNVDLLLKAPILTLSRVFLLLHANLCFFTTTVLYVLYSKRKD